jgi:hypothetical protein
VIYVTENPAPVRGSVAPLPVLIYRGFLPINLQLTRASKTAIPLHENIVLLFSYYSDNISSHTIPSSVCRPLFYRAYLRFLK